MKLSHKFNVLANQFFVAFILLIAVSEGVRWLAVICVIELMSFIAVNFSDEWDRVADD